MTKKQAIQLFEERKVRTVWDDEQEKWYFCVADVVEALTDSVNPTDYIKKMKKRDPELAKGWGQIVTPPCRQKLYSGMNSKRKLIPAIIPNKLTIFALKLWHYESKEYIAQNSDSIGHLAEVSQTFADLTPLRLDKQATDEYLNDDLNYQQYDRLTSDGYSNSETRYNA